MDYSECFARGYEHAADFCTEGDDLCEGVGWHPSTMTAFDRDCGGFVDANLDDLTTCGLDGDAAGADFFFTREGHGTGFWDHGNVGPLASAALDRLTDAAKACGPVDLYVGDDGWIYQLGEEA